MNEGTTHHTAIWLFIILVLVLFGAAVMFFSRNNPDLQAGITPVITESPSIAPKLYTVYYQLSIFSPTNLRIHVGDSVKFLNNGGQPMHVISNSTSTGALQLVGFDSIGDIQPNGAFTYTFTQAGIFGYHNVKNPDETGTVIVKTY